MVFASGFPADDAKRGGSDVTLAANTCSDDAKRDRLAARQLKLRGGLGVPPAATASLPPQDGLRAENSR
jgi:hypothetical protein